MSSQRRHDLILSGLPIADFGVEKSVTLSGYMLLDFRGHLWCSLRSFLL